MILFSNSYSATRRPNRLDKGMVMNTRYPKQIILLCVLVILPLRGVMAGSFSETLLRFTGISIAPSGVRGDSRSIIQGNLWVVKIDQPGTNEPRPITRDGTYHSPLWIPGSNKILTVKENNLVQLEINGSKEKILFPLSESTALYGFDKRDANTVLILQNNIPAMLSLTSGQITLLPYDKDNKEDQGAVAGLSRDSRKYGQTEVLIIPITKIFDAGGNVEEIKEIRIRRVDSKGIVIPCPENCTQPALTEDEHRLVFVGP